MSLLRRIWWRAAIVMVFAIVAWQIACWWTGPVVAYSLPLSRTVALQLLGFTQRGELIAAGVDPEDTRSARVCLWSVPSLKPTVIWRSPVSAVGTAWQFALSSDGRWLNIDLANSRLVLDLETGQEFPHSKEGMVWISPDGRFLMNDDRESGIEVSELQTGRIMGRIDDSWIDAISPNGEWVLASTGEGHRVWRIHDDKVTPTELTQDLPIVPAKTFLPIGPDDDSAGLMHHKNLWCHFTPDNRKLCIRVFGTYGIWQLDPPELIQTKEDFSIEGISADGLWAFLHDGSRVSLSGETVGGPLQFDKGGGFRFGPLLDGNSQFLAQNQPLLSPQAQKGLSIPLGDYELSLRPRSLYSKGCYALYDALTGELFNLPYWIINSPPPLELADISSFRPTKPENRAFFHPKRLALLSKHENVWIIPLPPARPWLKQLAVWLFLMVPMGWLVIRRFRPKRDDIFRPHPTDRVAPAPASASH